MANLQRAVPRTKQFASRPIDREQFDFRGGMYADTTLIPKNAVAYLKNFDNGGDELRGRGGSIRWMEVALPSAATGYSTTSTVSGSLRTITKTVGTDFATTDVGKWFVHDDGTHEVIVSRTSTTVIVTYTESTSSKTSTAGWIRNPCHCHYYHRSKKMHVLHIGTAVYVSTDNTFSDSAWNLAYNLDASYALADDLSQMDEYESYVFIFSNGHIFRLDLSSSPYYYLKCNSTAPSTLLTGSTTPVNKATYAYGRRHTYGCCRLTSTGHRDRSTSGVTISHESGTCKIDSNYKDYAEKWTGVPVGTGENTTGLCTTNAMSASYDAASDWSGVSDGRFNVKIDGTARDVVCNFTGCTTMTEVAERIQSGMQTASPASECTCEYNVSNKFELRSPLEGGTLTEVTASSGSGFTNLVGSSTYLISGGALSASNYTTPRFNDGTTVGTLTLPTYGDHWTHYSIWGTKDIGENGIDPISGNGNNEQLYVWVGDVPVARPFKLGYYSAGGTTIFCVNGTDGLFYREDEGSKLWIMHGTPFAVTILGLCDGSGSSVYTTTSNFAIVSGAVDASKTYTANDSTDVCTSAGHGYSDGDTVYIYNTTAANIPGGLAIGTMYYIINSDTDTFKLSLTAGGSAVDITSTGSGTNKVTKTTIYAAAFGDEGASRTISIGIATQSTTTVTATASVFTSADVGKTIFWRDGTYSYIKTYSSGTQVTVLDSTTRTSMTFCLNPVSRKYRDTTTDDVLTARQAWYTCQQRAHQEIPAVDVGIVVPGFVFAADADGYKVYYSPMPDRYDELVGYYFPGEHEVTVKDRIQTLWQYDDSLLVKMLNSTGQIDINKYDIKELADLGITLTKITGYIVLDHDNGITHPSAIGQLRQGTALVVTNEPAVRVCDGHQYSEENLATDKIMDILHSAYAQYSIGYDNFGGAVLWMRTGAYRMNRCFRYGFSPDQGIEWREITGTAFPIPEVGIRPVKVYDSSGNERLLVLNCKTGYLTEISTRDGVGGGSMFKMMQDDCGKVHAITAITIGVAGAAVRITASGLTAGWEIEIRGVNEPHELNYGRYTIANVAGDVWSLTGTDSSDFTAQAGVMGYCFKTGTEITPEVTFREDVGEKERYYIEHLQTTLYTRPWSKDLQDATNFDSNGYPDGLTATWTMYADGEDFAAGTASATANSISLPRHEWLFDQRVRGRRLQSKVVFNKTALCISGKSATYMAMDNPSPPTTRKTTEGTYQLSLAVPVVWLSRSHTNLLDLATGSTLSGTATTTTGPDALSNSAYTISAEVNLANAAQAAGTILLWHSSGYTISGHALTTVGTSGSWTLSYYTGAVAAAVKLGVGSVFDVRIYSTTIDSSTRTYLYNNMVNHAGKGVLPIFP